MWWSGRKDAARVKKGCGEQTALARLQTDPITPFDPCTRERWPRDVLKDLCTGGDYVLATSRCSCIGGFPFQTSQGDSSGTEGDRFHVITIRVKPQI
jgi:hypothetical protein